MNREIRIHIRASADEHRMLERLADREGCTSSDWMRRTIRTAYGKAFNVQPKPAKRTTKRKG